jgi:hypothetical protein
MYTYRICLGRWVGVAQAQPEDPATMKAARADQREHAAAASILACCALDLLSGERTADKAIETLSEVWTKPPIMEERIPFLILLAGEVAGEMQSTLYGLPYLPLLGSYKRPCQPPLA